MSTRGPQYIQGFDSGTTPDANGSHLTGFSSWNEETPERNRAARLHSPGHGFGSPTCDMSWTSIDHHCHLTNNTNNTGPRLRKRSTTLD
ncbi:unnamed protein product [Clonostachys rhizophaga]|uniref:Uncharacterized protein n=1 Tax=Clonostachys rhizophaga TaxID=160324 RepID=A0A9N9YEW9_9HYPO|nr:unnamed protein product [Clonostachys rhizophaga]